MIIYEVMSPGTNISFVAAIPYNLPIDTPDVGRVVISWNLGGLKCKRCGFNSCSSCNISFPHDTGYRDHDPVCDVWLLNLPCVCKGHYIYYVIVSIKSLTISGG